MNLFYSCLLWLTRFELAIAKASPARNQRYIAALQSDESEYERALLIREYSL